LTNPPRLGKLLGMTLSEFLTKNNQSVDEFAKAIGRSKWGVRKWLYGQRTPRSTEMRLIIKATDGAVTASDFFPPPPTEAAE